MLRLRKFILGLLWLVPFIYGLAAISLPFLIYRLISEPTEGYNNVTSSNPEHQIKFVAIKALLILLGISPATICVTSAGTILQYHRGKQNSRSWAITCGVAFVVIAVPLVVGTVVNHAGFSSSGAFGLLLFGMIQLAAGALIILAFLSRGSVSELLSAEVRPVKVKGDGTTSLSYLFTIAIVMVGLIVIDSQVRRWGQQHDLARTSGFLLGQLILFGALFISTVLHEFGHIAAGWSVGMKLLSVRIGPFHAEIKEGRWRLIPPTSLRSLFQGGVRVIPPKPQEYETSRAIWTAAGGPLANLVGGGIALLLLSTAKGSFYEPAWEWLGSIAAICVMFFLANLIPVREASAYSDGARIYQILTRNVMEDVRRIIAMTEASKISPVRPRDFDISLIEKTASNDAVQGHYVTFLHFVASDYYFDHDRMDEARTALSKAEAIARELDPARENCGALVLRAVCLSQDREMAEKWWERRLQASPLDPKNDSEFDVIAYRIVEGRPAEAEEAWRRQLERTNRLPDTGERAFDLRYLNRLRQLLDNALANCREDSIQSDARHSVFASKATTA